MTTATQNNPAGGLTIRRGERKQLRLRMLIDGPAKAGKSFTALRVAFSLAHSSPPRVLVIEAGERGATEKYAGDTVDDLRWDFYIIQLDSYSPETYTQAVLLAGREAYDVCIIDSLSHEWVGRDGAIQIADENAIKGNTFAGWKTATPLHDALFETILSSPCHVIATVRSKMDYVLQQNEHGKLEPIKVGLAPIQRDTVPYEFDVLLSMDQLHLGTVSGSRCIAIDGRTFPRPGPDLVKPLREWLETGQKADFSAPSASIGSDQIDKIAALLSELRWKLEKISGDFPKRYGCTELSKFTAEKADRLIDWLESQAKSKRKNANATPAAAAAAAAETKAETKAAKTETNGAKHEAPKTEPAASKPASETKNAAAAASASSASAAAAPSANGNASATSAVHTAADPVMEAQLAHLRQLLEDWSNLQFAACTTRDHDTKTGQPYTAEAAEEEIGRLWRLMLSGYGVDTAKNLTVRTAGQFQRDVEHKIEMLRWEEKEIADAASKSRQTA